MRKSKAVRPTPREVEEHLFELQGRHPKLVSVAEAGRSRQGRPIYAATVTGPQANEADKQHALIVAGQHGDEESGRMLALATLDWLVSPAGRATRARQEIVVMPCVNPDGAEADTHLTPGGVAPNLDHAPGGAKTPEGQAVERVADPLGPELFVDLHSRGYSGCSYDMVLYPETKPYTEDDNLLHEIAAAMARAGEKAGIPQITHPLTWPGWGGDRPGETSTTRYAYRRFKSIVILTETCEDNSGSYPAADRVRSGMAKIRTLLAYGNGRHAKLYHAGYPCGVVAGMFLSGIVAVGTTAADRRASRLAAWRNRDGFKRLDRCNPEQPRDKRLLLAYEGPALTDGVGVQTFARGKLKVQSVTLNGRRLRPSETDGYCTWHDGCSTFAMVAMPELAAGEYALRIRYR